MVILNFDCNRKCNRATIELDFLTVILAFNATYMSRKVRTSGWGLVIGRIKLPPKSTIPNSLYFVFSIPEIMHHLLAKDLFRLRR